MICALMSCMTDIADIRLQNLELLINEEKINYKKLADTVKTDPSYLYQIINHHNDRKMGTKLARRIEIAFQKPHGWMDVARNTVAFNVTLLKVSFQASLEELGETNAAAFSEKVVDIALKVYGEMRDLEESSWSSVLARKFAKLAHDKS